MRLDEFVTDDLIVTLLCKEKCKRIRRSRRSGIQRIDEELKELMPTRSQWLKTNKSKRFIRSIDYTNKQQIPRTALQFRNLKYTIRKHRAATPERDYIIRLNKYIDHIKSICRGETDFSFSKPLIIPKFKGETETEIIYRPISKYDTLDDKIMLNITNQYLSMIFDKFFHNEIFSYRIKRNYKGQTKITSQHDAIRSVKDYLEKNRDKEIFVAECDIRKFFDILNHMVIKEEFEELIGKFDGSEHVSNLFNSYIDSYSYAEDVAAKNNDNAYWNRYRINPRKRHKTRKFDWVDADSFIQNNIYTTEEWEKDQNRIGTPQGGSLSLLISNMVLNSVDKVFMDNPDPDRLFVRYGDDIMLMHTDRYRCQNLIEAYKNSLISRKLLFHPFKSISVLKEGDKITREYWNNKSKFVYRWGKGPGDAAHWIGFVGYEISRNGEVRIRKSTLSGQFSRINKAYHYVKKLDSPDRRSVMKFGDLVAEKIDLKNYATISSKFFTESFRELNVNRYSATQIKALDRYRNRKFRKLRRQFTKAGFNRDFYFGKPFSYYYHFGKLSAIHQSINA